MEAIHCWSNLRGYLYNLLTRWKRSIACRWWAGKVHLHHFSKMKVKKKSQNSINQGFSLYFCLMIEGSGSGSIPLSNWSGSRRPKNMWMTDPQHWFLLFWSNLRIYFFNLLTRWKRSIAWRWWAGIWSRPPSYSSPGRRWVRTSGPHRLRLGIYNKMKGFPFRFIRLLFFS